MEASELVVEFKGRRMALRNLSFQEVIDVLREAEKEAYTHTCAIARLHAELQKKQEFVDTRLSPLISYLYEEAIRRQPIEARMALLQAGLNGRLDDYLWNERLVKKMFDESV